MSYLALESDCLTSKHMGRFNFKASIAEGSSTTAAQVAPAEEKALRRGDLNAVVVSVLFLGPLEVPQGPRHYIRRGAIGNMVSRAVAHLPERRGERDMVRGATQRRLHEARCRDFRTAPRLVAQRGSAPPTFWLTLSFQLAC